MHGVIHKELQAFSVDRLGTDGWEAARVAADVPAVSYVTSLNYPDRDIPALLVALSKTSGMRVSDLVEDFGEYLAPALVARYHMFLEPDWGALDLFENTEEVIHRAVRVNDPGADPPKLRTSRPGPSEVRVVYDSPRRLCGLAKGIVRGVASHYGERVRITDLSCMLNGDAVCELSIETVG